MRPAPIATACLLLTGCSEKEPAEKDVAAAITSVKVDALVNRVDRLEAHIPRDYATFRVGEGETSWFATGPITLQVRVTEISDAPGGSAANVEIRNLTSGDHSDCMVRTEWGKTDAEGAFIPSTVRSDSQKLPPLIAGKYVATTLPLAGLSKKQIGRLTIADLTCLSD